MNFSSYCGRTTAVWLVKSANLLDNYLSGRGAPWKSRTCFLAPAPAYTADAQLGFWIQGADINGLLIFLFLFSFLSPQIMSWNWVATHMWVKKCIRKELMKCVCGVNTRTGTCGHLIAINMWYHILHNKSKTWPECIYNSHDGNGVQAMFTS